MKFGTNSPLYVLYKKNPFLLEILIQIADVSTFFSKK